jgi:hypothetical protein
MAISNGLAITSASEDGTVDSDGDGLIDLVEYLVAGSSLSQDGSDSIALDADSREFTLRRDSASKQTLLFACLYLTT